MNLELSRINAAIMENAAEYIAQCDAAYQNRIDTAAGIILKRLEKSRIILLSGPSASGKTTTASRVKKALADRGIHCHMISLDDYYRSKAEPDFPRTKDGALDLEAPEALRTELLNEHLAMLDKGEEILVPHFDFQNQQQVTPDAGWPLRLRQNEAVIFEGIHGLNPMLTDHHPAATRLFVSTASSFYEGEAQVFDRVWQRMIRRLVRDFNHRSSSAEDTLSMWKNVRLGEKKYISPYKKTAHISIDTTHGYEVSALRSLAGPLLQAAENNPEQALTHEILMAMERFVPLDWQLLPETSLLREEFLPK